MSLTNSDVAWIANNVEEWKEAYDRVCVFLDGGVEFFNSKYFPGKEGLNREEWQASRNKIEMSKILLGGEGNLTFSPEDAWAEDERRMNAMNNISGYWQHLKDDITAYDPPGPTTMPEFTFTTPDEDEAWNAMQAKQARYQDATGEDWIDEAARTFTAEEFRGAMRFSIGKYNRRMGKKDELIKEIEEMKDYCQRWIDVEKGR